MSERLRTRAPIERRNSVLETGTNRTFNNVGEYHFEEGATSVKMSLEWTTAKIDTICDLDINVLVFDEHARFVEKLTIDNPQTQDESCSLEADIDTFEKSKTHMENVLWNFNLVNPQTSCMLFCISGGKRNFANVEHMAIRCTDAFDSSMTDFSSSDFVQTVNSQMHANEFSAKEYFTRQFKPRRDSEALIAVIVYKCGRHQNGRSAWVCKTPLQPLLVSNEDEKDKLGHEKVIQVVPSLSKYRRHIYPSIKSLCASLSSTSLPLLKTAFSVGDGLQINAFTKVLLRQLFLQNPRVLDESEAAYTVAMLHDMFFQIDFNQNGSVDWDEFTTFCIYTGLVTADGGSSAGEEDGAINPLDDYHIEYVEDISLKDQANNKPHSQMSLMRYFPEVRRTLVIPEDNSSFSLFDDSFKEVSLVKPQYMFSYDKAKATKDCEDFMVYDVCYIPCRDLYCYTSSDHTLVLMKPHTDSTGTKVHYSMYNKIRHGYRHVKLCWSEGAKILCSVSASNDIFGWTVDGKKPVFQVSRHKELITDFLAIDDLGLFATSSLDKRIVLWSQSTQRVRGVLMGHMRGIKTMSYAKNTLVTAGFEMDARVWNVSLQENTLILRGHRSPLAAVKVMCQPKENDLDMRAISVDDRGEFRLWDIRAKTGTDVKIVGALKCFSLHGSVSLSQIRFLAIPYNPKYSCESYSNFICGSSKLIQFKPEKICKEFQACTHMIYSSGNTALLLAVGRSLFKYDIINGVFQNCIPNLDRSEIQCFCVDDRHRIYVGCTNGDLLLLKFSTGQVMCSIKAHHHPVTALSLVQLGNGCNMVFTGASDGTLRTIDDTCGTLSVNNTAGNVFYDRLSIAFIRCLQDTKMILAASNETKWAAFTDSTLKIMLSFKEESRVIDIVELVSNAPTTDTYGRGIATVVVCTAQYLKIYALDFKHMDFQISHVLGNTNTLLTRNFLSAIVLKCPVNSINYSDTAEGGRSISEMTLLAASDDGYLTGWDAKNFRQESIGVYFDAKPEFREVYMKRQEYLDSEAVTTKQNKKKLQQAFKMSQQYSDVPLLSDSIDDDAISISSSSSSSSSSSDPECKNTFSSTSADEDNNSLFSLTSKVGLVDIHTSSGVNVKRMAHTVRCDAEGNSSRELVLPPSSVVSSPPVQKQRNAILMKQDSYVLNLASNAVMENTIYPSVCWRVHDGAVSTLVGLDEHGCVVTSGVDGFQRIWNLQERCLGLLLLPNITEQMKEYYRQHPVNYRFIMEKIHITRQHEKLAEKLTTDLRAEMQPGLKGVPRLRREGTMGATMSVVARQEAVLKSHANFTEKDIAREGFLKVVATDYMRSETKEEEEGEGKEQKQKQEQKKEQEGEKDSRPYSSPSKLGPSAPDISSPVDFGFAPPLRLPNSCNSYSSKSTRTSNLLPQRPGTCPSPEHPPLASLSSMSSISSLNSSASSISPSSLLSAKSLRTHAAAKKMEAKKGIYGTEDLWVDSKSMLTKHHGGAKAFSEQSALGAMKDGLLDHEGRMRLRQIHKDAVKVKAYDRAVDTLLLRNCKQSTSVKVSSKKIVEQREVTFGSQKNMYSNANATINSRRPNTSNARHLMALTMIKHSAKRHEGSMVSQVDPLKDFNDNIVIPHDDSDDHEDTAQKSVFAPSSPSISSTVSSTISKSLSLSTSSLPSPSNTMKTPPKVAVLARSRSSTRRSGVVKMTISREVSASSDQQGEQEEPVIDRVRVAQWIQKVTDAEEGAVPEWEARETKQREARERKKQRKKRMENVSNTHYAVKVLESKLIKSITSFHKVIGEDGDADNTFKARPVTTRLLLPYYRAADFKSFLNVYLCVDEDFRGELDVEQWVHFFSKMKKTVSKKTAYLLFTDLDKDADGLLTIETLIEFMFAKANAEQLDLMKKHVLNIVKKNQAVGHEGLTEAEMTQMFEYYDEDFVGFIRARSLKDRLKTFNLPLAATTSISLFFEELSDDDMISLAEFLKLFKPYLIVDHVL